MDGLWLKLGVKQAPTQRGKPGSGAPNRFSRRLARRAQVFGSVMGRGGEGRLVHFLFATATYSKRRGAGEDARPRQSRLQG